MFKGLCTRGQTKWKYPEPSASHSFSPFGLWGRGTSANSYLEKTLLTYLHILDLKKAASSVWKAPAPQAEFWRVLFSWDGQGVSLYITPLLFKNPTWSPWHPWWASHKIYILQILHHQTDTGKATFENKLLDKWESAQQRPLCSEYM